MHPVETLSKCRVSSFFFLVVVFVVVVVVVSKTYTHILTCGTGWFSTLVEKFSAIGKILLSPGAHVSAVKNFPATISFSP